MRRNRRTVRYVIIGNSHAGLAAAEAIRKNDRKNQITIIAAEKYPAYGRPVISYVLEGKSDPNKVWLRSPGFYRNNQIETLLGKRVTQVKPVAKQLDLEDGHTVTFDKLLIATGSRPFLPPIKGLDSREKVFTFGNLDDVKRIERLPPAAKKAVVLGGGLIGLKAAESLRTRGVDVTVIELSEQLLCTILDKKSAEIVRKVFLEAGVRIILQNTIREIQWSDRKIEGVVLRSNEQIECDFLIVAVGVVPNIDLVEKTDIKINKGILVNEYLETTAKDIYAAGDVAEAYHARSNSHRLLQILPAASKQGKVAGRNMSGERVEYEGDILFNSTSFFNFPVMALGSANSDHKNSHILVKYEKQSNTYSKVIVKQDRLVGAIFLGEIRRAGIYNWLIRNQISVKDFKDKLLDDDFGLISLPRPLWESQLLH